MERHYISILLLILFIAIGLSHGSIFQSLHDYVSPKLQPYVLPQTSPSEPVTVALQTRVYAIDEVDRRRNELIIRSWFMATWNSTITWDPKDFNDLTTILFPTIRGFVPQVASLSSAGSHEVLSPVVTRYLSNGLAVFYLKVRWGLLCDLSDDDTCRIKMYSSDYDNNAIRLRHVDNIPANMDLVTADLTTKNSEYKIVSESYSQGSETLEGVPGSPDWVQYQFSFKKRRSSYYDKGPMAIFKWY